MKISGPFVERCRVPEYSGIFNGIIDLCMTGLTPKDQQEKYGESDAKHSLNPVVQRLDCTTQLLDYQSFHWIIYPFDLAISAISTD